MKIKQSRAFNFLKQKARETQLSLVFYLFSAIKMTVSGQYVSASQSLLLLTNRIGRKSFFNISLKVIYKSFIFNRAIKIHPSISEAPLQYSILIKPYVSDFERGILIVSFEKELSRIVFNPHFSDIEKKYTIIFVPSTSGILSFPLATLGVRANRPFFIMPVNEEEKCLCESVSPLCVALPFNAASWINENAYTSQERERDIDCLMVASFSKVKRHKILFKALRKSPQYINVFCVGFPLGERDRNSIVSEAKEFGVEELLEVVENPTQSELRDYFSRAKVFCAMSYREGSFIAVAEALVSGTPVVAFRNATFGTKSLINKCNGEIVNNICELTSSITRLIREKPDYSYIRENALETNGSIRNGQKLNELLKNYSNHFGVEWTSDIERFYSMRLRNYYHDRAAHTRLSDDLNFLEEKGIWFKP